MIVKRKGGPYVSSVSNGAAVLQELRARGCDDERLNRLLQRAPRIMARPASNVMASFAALDDILQLSRSDVLCVCEEQPSLLSTDAGSLRRNWAKVQERYQLPPKVVRSLQKMMRYSWCTTALLSYDSDTVEQRLSGLQQLFGLSDGDLVALFRCLVELLGLKPEEVVRPRRDKLEALLGPFDKQMLRRFIQSRFVLRLPVATMEAVFEGAAELMGGVEAAQQLLRAEPKLFAAGVQRLRLNLAALQHPVAGCTLEEARQVLLSTPQLSVFALDTPKFRRRMEALTDFYEHANTAEMLLSRNRGTHLMSSLWTVGPRMAFVRHLRLERGQPDLRTSQVACTLGPFCRSVRADVATYKGFEAAWLASPEAAQLCEHERPRRQATGAGALGSSGSGGGVCSSSSSSSSDDDDSSSSEKDERG